MPHLGFSVSTMANYSSCLKFSAHAQPFDQYVGLTTGFKYAGVIDQALSQDGEILAEFCLGVFMNLNEVKVCKSGEKKNEANIQPSRLNKLGQ